MQLKLDHFAAVHPYTFITVLPFDDHCAIYAKDNVVKHLHNFLTKEEYKLGVGTPVKGGINFAEIIDDTFNITQDDNTITVYCGHETLRDVLSVWANAWRKENNMPTLVQNDRIKVKIEGQDNARLEDLINKSVEVIFKDGTTRYLLIICAKRNEEDTGYVLRVNELDRTREQNIDLSAIDRFRILE